MEFVLWLTDSYTTWMIHQRRVVTMSVHTVRVHRWESSHNGLCMHACLHYLTDHSTLISQPGRRYPKFWIQFRTEDCRWKPLNVSSCKFQVQVQVLGRSIPSRPRTGLLQQSNSNLNSRLGRRLLLMKHVLSTFTKKRLGRRPGMKRMAPSNRATHRPDLRAVCWSGRL
jgi:hypothetical protein